METKYLEEFGLSKNEAVIYLFLLKRGESTTGPIIKETRIANSRVYESLNSLISKGFVTYNIQKKGKHFQTVDPKALLEIENERKKKLQEIIPELSSLKNSKKYLTNTAIFDGFNGFKTAFKRIIDECPRGETIYILGFSKQTYKEENLRLFISNMNLKSVEKKQKLKILLDRSSKETLGKDRAREKYTEVRYMPKGYVSPAAIDIFLDYVFIFLWEEKPFVFMIKNKRIADSFKQYFNFLWKIARK